MAQNNYETVEQDQDAHVKYSVSWGDWLTDHGFTSAQIESFAWSIVPSTASTTHTSAASSVASIWVRNIQAGRSYAVTCRISCPEPTSGAGSIKDDFTFVIRGTSM
jgi:hypothetical protein